jgi:hypothetical protein
VSYLTLFAIAGVTLGSRVVALALLPPPTGATAGVVRRLPAPLFAALAAFSFTDAGATKPPILAAVLCALIASRRSSLLLALVAGLTGFAAVAVLS